MGVGIDRQEDAGLRCPTSQRILEIQALGRSVDLQRRLVFRRRLNHAVDVDVGGPPLAQETPGGMADDVDMRMGDRPHQPLRELLTILPQSRVDGRHHKVEFRQDLIVEIEAAVGEDVNLHPGEDLYARARLLTRAISSSAGARGRRGSNPRRS